MGGSKYCLKLLWSTTIPTSFCSCVKKCIRSLMAEMFCARSDFSLTRRFYFDLEEGFHYDICFLDIEMPQMNGLDLAKKIRASAQATYLVFITSYLQYAVEGYEVKAFPISQKSPGREA